MIFLYIKKIVCLIIFYCLGGSSAAKFLGVEVGENCRLYIKDYGSEPFLVRIGNNVTITSGVRILTHDGSTWLMRDTNGRRYKYQAVAIGNNVFVGENSIILPGVLIDDNVIVAAGSIVTKSVPSGCIVAGNPAKIVGNFNDLEHRALSQYISSKDLDSSKPYKERVLSALTNSQKDFLKFDD